MFLRTRLLGVITALGVVACQPLWAAGDSRFSVSVGSKNDLMITQPDGLPLTSLSAPTLDRPVKVQDSAFRVSYGRDANGQLTAIFTPADANVVSLHFSAGGKTIDADKAVVTLTFSPNLKTVVVDPGYVGTVEVDSHVLRARDLAEDERWNAPAAAATPQPELASAAPAQPDTTSTSAAPEPAPSAPPAATAAPAEQADTVADSAVAPSASSLFAGPGPGLASQLHPVLTPTSPDVAVTTPRYHSIHDADAKGPMKLYWSEPVTGPDGTAPQVALDEMKLVELQGVVTVVLPSGESHSGTEGMTVPSGSTVRTDDNSSVAIFMGGVNSARLMPRCELVVTQTYAGSLRTDLIDLHRGAVFSRVGHRAGEVESFTVRTPEGSTQGESNDMMAYRGTPDDLRNASSTTRAGLFLNPKELLAWNPAPSHGLISDVASSAVSLQTSIGWVPNTYFFFTGGLLRYTTKLIRNEVLTNHNANAATASQSEPDYVLQAVLLALQPFNAKLNTLLAKINSGTETPAQLAYYHNLVTVFFDNQAPTLINDYLSHKKGLSAELNQGSAILFQDLREFSLPALTPK